MQSSSRAPELSATLSRDSCWIIALPRLLDDVDETPALGLRQRSGLDDAHDVALPRLVALVMRVQRARAADDLLVSRVPAGDVDADGDRLVAFVGDDDALADLGRVRLALGDRRAGAGFVVGLHRGAFLAPFVRLLLAAGGAGGGALLDRLLRARFVRLARLEDAATLLPGK